MNDREHLQALLDKGGDVVFPAGEYTIDAPLFIGDNTRLHCTAATVLHLKTGAGCALLRNRVAPEKDCTSGFTVEGGVWDGNNSEGERGEALMNFVYVKDFTLRDFTVTNPSAFCIMLTDSERYTAENLTFLCNDRTLNEDGIHVNGFSRDGYIHNIKGHTNDDMIALNADEGAFLTTTCNDIENILIDGVFAGDNGWTGVRLLSRHARVSHVTIRNVYGAFKFNAVNITHWAHEPGDYGYFDDLVLENLHVRSCRKEGTGHGGLIWFQDDLAHIGNVVVSGVYRAEEADQFNTTSLLEVGGNVHIRNLTLSGIFEQIPDEKPTVRIAPTAVIEHLFQK